MSNSKPVSKSASAKFIFATIFLDALGIGLLIPVMPNVIRRFGADPEFVSHYFGYFIAVYALMQFLASPVLGSLSDRYGRRPVLLISLLFAGLDYILMALAPNLTLLFIGRVISGLTGASMTVASSYMADISNDDNRSANFGLIGAAWGFGFIVGPALGGLLGEYGAAAPFFGAAVLNLLNFAFGIFILPESLPEDQRRQIDLAKLNPFASLMKVLKAPHLSVFVFSFFLLYLAGNSHPAIWTLFTEYKFAWTATEVGLSMSFTGIMIAFSQGYLTRVVIPKWGERKAIFVGLSIEIFSFILYAIATQGWMMYAITMLFAVSGVAGPALQAVVTKRVPANEQGELQGSLISIGSLAAIIAPILYTYLFSGFSGPQAISEFPGVPYLVAGLVCAFAVLLLWRDRKSI